MHANIREMLASIEKPYRLAGGEAGSLVKDWDRAAVRFCLAFPDTYEMGMSHLGLAILYDALNSSDDFLAERVFTPWIDAQKEFKRRDIPLFSIDSQRPVSDFDVLGITLPYELTYTNILTILELSQIPFRSRDRNENHPFVIGGGPSAFNPEPVADFFDAIVLGDGESVILEIANAVKKYKEKGFSREELLKNLASIEGVYVPAFYADCASGESSLPKIKKAKVSDLNKVHFPKTAVVAHAAIQDRVGIEIQRGCVRGCRFCQAGMIYRPVRQRSAKQVSELSKSQLLKSGHRDLSLLSLSVGDYDCLENVLTNVEENLTDRNLNVSLPSLRTESLTDGVLAKLGKSRSGSFTLAPEAATERMRAFINKGNTDKDLFDSVEKVFKNGWSKIKLYFMVGLPGETKEDIEGIVKVANKCIDIGRRYHKRPDVTVSTSTFVPKPHTPLQWCSQICIDESLEIQKYLKKELKRPGLYYRWHNANMSFLEGVFSRGGRELADVIEQSYRLGARFDGWDDSFDMSIWTEAFNHCGVDPASYHTAHEKAHRFPWDHLFADLDRNFLWREYERAKQGEFTPSCVDGPCQQCGVCDFAEFKNYIYTSKCDESCEQQEKITSKNAESIRHVADKISVSKIRIKFSKTDRSAFLGHLELLDAIRRIMRCADLPVAYSQGYHPRPKISLGRALPVGIESLCEFADVSLYENVDLANLVDSLNAPAPNGISFLEASEIESGTPSLDSGISAVCYEVAMNGSKAIDEDIAKFNGAKDFPVTIMRRDKERTIDLKEVVRGLALEDESVVVLWINCEGTSVKAKDALRYIFHLTDEQLKSLCIKKAKVEFATS